MTRLIHLSPHDPIPEPGHHGLVLRHLGEDDPNAITIEIIFHAGHGHPGASTAAVTPQGHAMTLEQAIKAATHQAEKHGVPTLYVIDRTAGKREQEVLHNHGDHSFPKAALDDQDTEDGVSGSNILDRPHDAGFVR